MIRRREFITLLGGAAITLPTTARAQQPAMPVIGFLSSVPFETRRDQVAGFHRGLNESGYVEAQNVAIEYRSADNQIDRLPTLAADLVSRGVTVIVTIGGDNSIRAAKAASTTIPVVFVTGFDPVAAGFVASLNRPGGNLTGVNFLVVLTVAKRLGLLSELAPAAATIGMLVNPDNPNAEVHHGRRAGSGGDAWKETRCFQGPHRARSRHSLCNFRSAESRGGLGQSDPFFLARREQVVALAARHALAAI